MIQGAEAEVRRILTAAFQKQDVISDKAFARDGMKFGELVRLYALVREFEVRQALEVGMATGTSSVVIAEAIRQNQGECLTSIDPFQTAVTRYDSAGLQAINAAGLANLHRLIESPNYLSLPRLVEDGAKYDLVLVDGYHSLDFTMVDVFYADLLLKVGGVLTIHDSPRPAVYDVTQFLERLKPYERISPPVMIDLKPFASRLIRRLQTATAGTAALQQAKERREVWFSLSAYRKSADQQAEEYTHHRLHDGMSRTR